MSELKCECRIEYYGHAMGGHNIVKCALCSAAPELYAACKVAMQFALEVAHAQDVGPDWYTKGESGMYQQVRMWIKKAHDAVSAATAKAEGR